MESSADSAWFAGNRRRVPHKAKSRRGNKPDVGYSQHGGCGDGKKHDFKPYHALNVPKHRQLEVNAKSEHSMHATTAMLRNIPNKYTQAGLLEEIDNAGFADSYDFFYLPIDMHNRANVGYAFINFLVPEEMARFTHSFTDYRFQKHSSDKIARVSTAHIQGLAGNLNHFSSCAVARSQHRPVVKYHGHEVNIWDLRKDTAADSLFIEMVRHHTQVIKMRPRRRRSMKEMLSEENNTADADWFCDYELGNLFEDQGSSAASYADCGTSPATALVLSRDPQWILDTRDPSAGINRPITEPAAAPLVVQASFQEESTPDLKPKDGDVMYLKIHHTFADTESCDTGLLTKLKLDDAESNLLPNWLLEECKAMASPSEGDGSSTRSSSNASLRSKRMSAGEEQVLF